MTTLDPPVYLGSQMSHGDHTYANVIRFIIIFDPSTHLFRGVWVPVKNSKSTIYVYEET